MTLTPDFQVQELENEHFLSSSKDKYYMIPDTDLNNLKIWDVKDLLVLYYQKDGKAVYIDGEGNLKKEFI
tara:strand:- start:2169 stop:2378 length:210 start_codon:yes stop_codon:yes gene_type:complete